MQTLKQHIQTGEVYRRSDLELYSTAVDRHLHLLVEDGTLQKLNQGLYYAPKKSKFGIVPPNDLNLIERFLRDNTFLLLSPNAYNSLGLGLTQLYNTTWVYNHKRRGAFVFNGKNFLFKLKPSFPNSITTEYLVIDLLNNLNELAEDPVKVINKFVKKIDSYNDKELEKNARQFGTGATQKLVRKALSKNTLKHG